MKKVVCLMMIVLILAMPFSYSQTSSIQDYYERPELDNIMQQYNLGEAITINVKAYEPTVLDAALVEDDFAYVYAFLEGRTLGSMFGQKEESREPLYGIPKIKSMIIATEKASRYANVQYLPPVNRQYIVNEDGAIDLGVLKVNFNRFYRESSVPGEEKFELFGGNGSVDIDMVARIRFDTERLAEFGEEDLQLTMQRDEQAWKRSEAFKSSFWNSRGYIRASRIGSNDASLVVYDSGLRPIRTISLREGELSQSIRIGELVRQLLNNEFKIQLMDIIDPGSRRATIKIVTDYKTYTKNLKEGETLYPGSRWRVKTISKYYNGNDMMNLVILETKDGSSEVKLTLKAEDGKGLESKLLEGFSINSVGELDGKKIGGYIIKVDDRVKEKKLELSFEDNLELGEILDRVITKDNSLLYEKDNDKITISDSAQKNVEGVSVCEEIDEVVKNYCNSIKSFNDLLEKYPDSVETINLEDGTHKEVLYSDKANYWLGRTYEDLANYYNNAKKDSVKYRAALSLARDYYNKVREYNSGSANDKLKEINEKISKNIISEAVEITEEDDSIAELTLLKIVEGSTMLSRASIEVNNDGREFKEGDVLLDEVLKDKDGREFKWSIGEIGEDYVKLRKKYIGVAPSVIVQPSKKLEDLNPTERKTVEMIFSYRTIINKAHEKYPNVDVTLIEGVIRQEAPGGYTSISPCGAVGLMQLMPGIAKDYGSEDGLDIIYGKPPYTSSCDNPYAYDLMDKRRDIMQDPDIQKLQLDKKEAEIKKRLIALDERFDPEKNIMVGTKYLSKLISDNGDILVALRHYVGLGKSGENYPADVLQYKQMFDSLEGSYTVASTTATPTSTGVSEEGTFTLRLKTLVTNLPYTDRTTVRLTSTELHRSALVTIVPSDSYTYSESRFKLHIPIEKRLLKLTPETIDKEINKTEKRLAKLEEYITKLDNLVKNWNKACIGVWVYTMAKSFLFTSSAEAMARRNVMTSDPVTVGDKTYNGWKDYCIQNLASEPWKNKDDKKYETYTDCINDHSEEIEKQIKEATEVIKKVDSEIKSIGTLSKDENWEKLASKLDSNTLSKEDVMLLHKYNLLSESEAKNLFYLKMTDEEKYKKKVDTMKLKDDVNTYRKIDGGLKEYADYLKARGINDPYSDVSYYNRKEFAQDSVNAEFKSETKMMPEISDKLITTLYMVQKDNGMIVRDKGVNPDYNYFTYIEGRVEPLYLKKLLGKDGFFEGTDGKLYSTNRVDDAIYTSFYKEGNNPKIQVDTQGRPVKVPYRCREGYADWINIDYSGNKPSYSLTNDNNIYVPVLPDNRNMNQQIEAVASRVVGKTFTKGKSVNLEGIGCSGQGKYEVDDSEAKLRELTQKIECQDVMDVKDCKLLFNVCDPVMCPTSRFNLNGRWTFRAGESVAQTGLVGSIVLGLPNWGKDQPIPPVCLTGIDASLKNYRSFLQGYKACLIEAKMNDRSVGVCDKIRSIFVCEQLWETIVMLYRLRTNIVSLVAEKMLGKVSGGGEYLSFENKMEEVSNNMKFFTKEYATSAFAAYQARSTSEIGSQICKSSVNGKLPSVGDMMEQLTRPENPPQFTAVLSEDPFMPSFKQSRYNVFYHIYAGETPETVYGGPLPYSVYLYDPYGVLPPYYATERCRQSSAMIPQGGYAMHSLDCIATSGYSQVCVSINGIPRCGFGKVSSGFTLNYLNNQLVKQEVEKKIESAEDCTPDMPSYDRSITNIASGGSGLLTTGVRRVCSVINPGAAIGRSDDWRYIGNCGVNKENGQNYGFCWLDVTSVTMQDIRDKEVYNNITQFLKDKQTEFDDSRRGYTKEELDDLIKEMKKNEEKASIDSGTGEIIVRGEKIESKDTLNSLLGKYTDLSYHPDKNIAANAQFLVGMIYYNLARIDSKIEEEKAGKIEEQIKEKEKELEEKKDEEKTITRSVVVDMEEVAKQCTTYSPEWQLTTKQVTTNTKLTVKEGDTVKMVVHGVNCENVDYQVEVSRSIFLWPDKKVILDEKTRRTYQTLEKGENTREFSWTVPFSGDDEEYYFEVFVYGELRSKSPPLYVRNIN